MNDEQRENFAVFGCALIALAVLAGLLWAIIDFLKMLK